MKQYARYPELVKIEGYYDAERDGEGNVVGWGHVVTRWCGVESSGDKFAPLFNEWMYQLQKSFKELLRNDIYKRMLADGVDKNSLEIRKEWDLAEGRCDKKQEGK